MKLLITRHGQTDWNVEGRMQGRTDIPLNDTGIKQAEATKEKLLKYDIDICISSPLQRAIKTAQIMLQGRNTPIIIEDNLTEMDIGKFAGKRKTDISWEDVRNNKEAETKQQLDMRVNEVLRDIKRKYTGTVLIVTHSGIVQAISSILENKKFEDIKIDNCEIKEYEI